MGRRHTYDHGKWSYDHGWWYTVVMLEVLFGGQAAERVLLYLQAYGEGHARGIATTFGAHLFSIQRQLRRLEEGGVLVSRLVGRTRVFSWNPRYPLQVQLRALLAEAFEFLPESEIKAYYRQRRRPRRFGKAI